MVTSRRVRVLATMAVVACSGSDATAPHASPDPTAATSLASGSRFTCALTSAGKAYCWGDGLAGQIGDSTYSPKTVPTASAGAHTYVAIAAADQTACALDRAGIAWCWGDDPTRPNVALSILSVGEAVASPHPLRSITVGRRFGCGLDDSGTAYCWGDNYRGQLGVADTIGRAGATRVSGSLHFAALAAGFWHVCGLTTSGGVYCWGDNSFGELASGDTALFTAPHQISGSTLFRFISSGSIHSCGIATNGHTLCWGANFSGQLGDGTQTGRLTPVEAAPGLTFTSVHAERANSVFTHTCGITVSGDVYCWGWNSKTQLGVGGTTDACTNLLGASTFVCSYTPVRVNGLSGVTGLAAGLEHTCALAGRQVYCWGDNSYGELGDGTGISAAVPVAVKGGLLFP
jgi:alpha-tubulin suppressor-like RCC1 family protein